MKNKAEEKENKAGLERSLGVFSVFAICTGAAFSSGFFLLPGLAAEISGPALPFAYLAAGILMLPAILSISELSAAMPRSGGPYFFVTRSFGPFFGLIGAFGKYIQLILKGAFAFVGVGIYLSLILQVPQQLLAVVLILIFTFLNLLDVSQTAKTEQILVVILIVILSYYLIAGVVEISTGPRDFLSQFQPLLPLGWDNFLSTIALVYISFGGVAEVASVAEEVKKPARTFPIGMLWSLAVSTFFYLAGTAIMVALLSPEALRGDNTPAATAAAALYTLPLPAIIMVAAALAAFVSTGNAAILSASRYPLALTRDQLLWKKFGQLNKNGVPKYAVLLSGFLTAMIVLLLDVSQIAKIASAFLLFVFLSLCLSLIIFRESRKEEYQPKFKSPFYPWTQIIGSLAYIWLMWESGIEALSFIALVVFLGALWYVFGIKEKPQLTAAIYNLFARISKTEGKDTAVGTDKLTMGGGELNAVLAHAIFIDLKKEASFEDAIKKAAEALKEHLGGDKTAIAEILQKKVKHWMHPFKFNISVAPLLMNGIEQPEIILIRGTIDIGEKEIKGLIVVVDDEESPGRLLKLVSQLEVALNQQNFHKAWQNAKGAEEIKKSLSLHISSFSISIKETTQTQNLIGQKTENLELPENSVLGAIYRDGELLVPTGDVQFQKDDELIIIAQGEALQDLNQRFN